MAEQEDGEGADDRRLRGAIVVVSEGENACGEHTGALHRADATPATDHMRNWGASSSISALNEGRANPLAT